MSQVETLQCSVDVAAPPERVWSLVTDLARMSRWSPQVVRTFVRGGAPVQQGTRTLNINRRGVLVWPTQCTVILFEPHREFGFRVKDNGTIWAFVLEPTAAGTRLVQERRAPDGMKPISTRFQDALLGGVDSFTEELRVGMQQTLARIKADAEA
jgi:uncharacterized protein YndB with AHSA1/START domain